MLTSGVFPLCATARRSQVQQAVSESGLGEAALVQDSITLAYAGLNPEDVLMELLPAGLTVCPPPSFFQRADHSPFPT